MWLVWSPCITFIVSNLATSSFPSRKGVFQGGTLSPLIFPITFHPIIQLAQSLSTCGFRLKLSLTPRHKNFQRWTHTFMSYGTRSSQTNPKAEFWGPSSVCTCIFHTKWSWFSPQMLVPWWLLYHCSIHKSCFTNDICTDMITSPFPGLIILFVLQLFWTLPVIYLLIPFTTFLSPSSVFHSE